MGSQHPSPNVKTFYQFEPQIWLEIITSLDAKSACFKASRTSCREIIFGVFLAKIWPEKITSRDGCFLPIKYILNSQRFFDVYVFVSNSTSLTETSFHVCVPLGTETLPNEFEADLGKVIFAE